MGTPITHDAQPAPVEVTFEKLVYGGEALGRIEGQVVLVPYTLPGERALVTLQQVKKGLLRGNAVEVRAPSAERVEPRCEYFGSCGGCQYQHANYDFELAQKVGILRETLYRLGRIAYEGDISVISGEPWFYRNRVQLHARNGQIGFHRAGSHSLQPIDHCYIAAPELVEAIARLNEAAKKPQWPAFLRSFELFSNGGELQLNIVDSTKPLAARFFEWCGTFLPALASGAIEYRAAGMKFRISGASFFQVNRFLIDQLVSETLGETEGEYAVDLYAGVGLFALGLANKFARVDAVERGSSAVRDLEANVAENASAVRAVRSSSEDFVRAYSGVAPDLIVADPPRAGLGRETAEALLRVRPRRLTLVSCDPATLARDASHLLSGYRIRRLALVDLFPQTFHFETVMHLEQI